MQTVLVTPGLHVGNRVMVGATFYQCAPGRFVKAPFEDALVLRDRHGWTIHEPQRSQEPREAINPAEQPRTGYPLQHSEQLALVLPGVQEVLKVEGREYRGGGVDPVTVPEEDVPALVGNGWLRLFNCTAGPSSARPTNPWRGCRYADTDLQVELVHDGASWRNPFTGERV